MAKVANEEAGGAAVAVTEGFDRAKDYGNGAEITSPEELERFLAEQGAEELDENGKPVPPKKDTKKPAAGQQQQEKKPAGKAEKTDDDSAFTFDDKQADAAKKKAAAAAKKAADDAAAAVEAGAGGNEETEEEEEEEESEVENYPTLIHYLNDEHKLNLNVEALPKEMTREQEAEAISTIMKRMTTNVNNAVSKYEHIATLMSDPEIRQVIEAKASGKTLRDVFEGFRTTTEGMDSETLVKDDLKKRYKNMKEEVILKMIDGYKKTGEFENIATSIREQRKLEETATEAQRAQQEQQRQQQQTLEYQQNVQKFSRFVGGIKTIYGVPVDEEMKNDIIEACTVRDEETGETYLDQALQSEEGLAMAALGLLHLKKLVAARSSIETNRKKDQFMDKLFDDPSKLQSKSGDGTRGTNTEQMDVAAMNSF